MNAAARPELEIFRNHGGKIETARALYPQVRAPWIDLSTGISPWRYPFAALPDEAFTRLPSPESIAELEVAAAESFGVGDPECVIAVPGSDLALRALARVFAGRRVAVVRPGYSGHVLAWDGARISSVVADEIERGAREHDVLVLANPNNPDGRVVERDRLLKIAAMLGARGGALVVDEAFADITPELSVCSSFPGAAAGLVVFRSFGKFFGLAGVRLGFVVTGDAAQRRAFRHAVGDWPVSGPAVSIGTAAYRDIEWQQQQRERLISSARRLDDLLTSHGDAPDVALERTGAGAIDVVGGTPLFRLARCADGDALFRHLLSHGILTRPFTGNSHIVRFGLPGEESQWSRLTQALRTRSPA